MISIGNKHCKPGKSQSRHELELHICSGNACGWISTHSTEGISMIILCSNPVPQKGFIYISCIFVRLYNHDLENIVQYVQVYIYTFKFYGTLLAHVYVNICKYCYHHFPHPLGFLPRKNHGKKRSGDTSFRRALRCR